MKLKTLLPAIGILILTGCKKDPAPPASTNAEFTIHNCGTTSVQGGYYVGTSLTSTNTITLQVNVTKTGTYSVTTATINGFKFTATGSFGSTGIQNLVLTGNGAPVNTGNFVFLATAGTSTCTFAVVTSVQLPGNIDNDHMLFGNPSKAAALIDSGSNYLLRKAFYSLSYNRFRGTANWVSWHLFNGDLGGTPRQDDFRADNTLPPGWYQVQPNSFSGSGFDRGHNTPSGDRTSSVDANSSTFLMTNMIPQAPSMNQGPWEKLEDSLRRLVSLGNELYIIMGSYGTGGTGNNGPMTTLDAGNVTVPSNVWKIALVIANGNGDSARVDANARVIAVNIPNNNSSTANWKTYRTSVDAIEAATGLDIFGILPTPLQAILEVRVDAL
jgi:endonuclease G